jgi:hypothetical protein
MIVGGDAPESPYPIHLEGAITHGFGRGARFLGIPTGALSLLLYGRKGILIFSESTGLIS